MRKLVSLCFRSQFWKEGHAWCYLSTHTHACTYAHIQYTHTMHACTRTHAHALMHTHSCTHTHTHTHACTHIHWTHTWCTVVVFTASIHSRKSLNFPSKVSRRTLHFTLSITSSRTPSCAHQVHQGGGDKVAEIEEEKYNFSYSYVNELSKLMTCQTVGRNIKSNSSCASISVPWGQTWSALAQRQAPPVPCRLLPHSPSFSHKIPLHPGSDSTLE